MGVAAFFRWLVSRYPKILFDITSEGGDVYSFKTEESKENENKIPFPDESVEFAKIEQNATTFIPTPIFQLII